MKIFRTRIKYIFVLAAVLTLSLFVFFTGCGEKKVTSPIDFVAGDKGEEEETLDPSTIAFNEKMCRLIAKGTKCDLTVGLGDKTVKADITVAFYYKDILVSLDLPVNGESIKVDVQFTENGQFIFFEAFGQKVVYDVKDTAEVVARLTALLTGGDTSDAGIDEILNMVLPVLEELDMLEILPMIPALIGDVRMGGGFTYVLNIADGITVVMNVNDNFTFDLIELRGVLLGKKELVVKLDGFTEDYEIPAACNPEEYSDVLDYLALLENFCDEYDIPVKELVDYFKNSDFGKLAGFVNVVKNTKTLGATLGIEVGGCKINAVITLDFSEKLKLRASINAFGMDFDVYYSDNNIYVVKDSLAVKTDFEGIGKLMASFAGKESGISLPAVNIQFNSVQLTDMGIAFDLGDIKFNLDLVNLKLGLSFFGADIAAELCEGEKVTVPQLDYEKLNDLIGIAEMLKSILDNKALLLTGCIDAQGTAVEVENLNVSFENGISLSGGIKTTISGKEISAKAVYVGGDLYLSVTGINLKLDKAALDGVVGIGTEILGKYGTELFGATEIFGGGLNLNDLFGYLTYFDIETDSLKLNVGGVELTVKLEDDKIHVEAVGKDFNVSLMIGEGFKEIQVPNGIYLEIGADVIDLLSKIDFDNVFAIVADISEKKYLGVNLAVRVPDIKVGSSTVKGFDVKGYATLDFGDGLKLALNLELLGTSAEVYLVQTKVEGTAGYDLYLIVNGMAFHTTLDDLTDFMTKFITLDMGGISNIVIKNIAAEGNEIAVNFGKFIVKADPEKLSFGVEMSGVSIDISQISAGEQLQVPEITYNELNTVYEIVDKIYGQFSEKQFAINGSFVLGDTTVTLENVRVADKGTGAVAENFDAGLLDIAGSLGLYLNGRTPADGAPDHGFDITFFENNLYVTYKHGTSESPRHTDDSAMNVKFNRSTLDNILAKVMENIETIANMFMPSGAYESLTSADKKKIDLSEYIGYLTELSTFENALNIKFDASAFNLGNFDISLVHGGENVLALGLVSETVTVNLALVSNEVEISAPNGEFMDLSNMEQLVEGLLVTVTKDSKQFVLSGTAGFKFSSSEGNTVSIGLKLYLTHGKVKNVNDKGETVEKTVFDARLEIDAPPPKIAGTLAIASGLHGSVMAFGKTTVWINGEGIYVARQEVATKLGIIWPNYGYKATEYKYLPLNECNGKTLTNFICYILGFKGAIKDAIVNAETAPMDYAQLLKGYSNENGKHSIKLNMLELINNKSFNDLDLALTLGENNYVNVIGVNMGVAGILDVTATLNHNPDENVSEGYIYSGFDNNYSKYSI